MEGYDAFFWRLVYSLEVCYGKFFYPLHINLKNLERFISCWKRYWPEIFFRGGVGGSVDLLLSRHKVKLLSISVEATRFLPNAPSLDLSYRNFSISTLASFVFGDFFLGQIKQLPRDVFMALARDVLMALAYII